MDTLDYLKHTPPIERWYCGYQQEGLRVGSYISTSGGVWGRVLSIEVDPGGATAVVQVVGREARA